MQEMETVMEVGSSLSNFPAIILPSMGASFQKKPPWSKPKKPHKIPRKPTTKQISKEMLWQYNGFTVPVPFSHAALTVSHTLGRAPLHKSHFHVILYSVCKSAGHPSFGDWFRCLVAHFPCSYSSLLAFLLLGIRCFFFGIYDYIKLES